MKKIFAILAFIPALACASVSGPVNWNGLALPSVYLHTDNVWLSRSGAGYVVQAHVTSYPSAAAYISNPGAYLNQFNLPAPIPHTAGKDPIDEVNAALMSQFPGTSVAP